MIFKKLLLVTSAALLITAGGCSKDNAKPGAPGFKDGSPPTPTTESAESSLPEPIGLNKGATSTAIEKSIELAGKDLNINEQLRLKSILSGYHGFDQYVFDAQIRDTGKIKKVYADTGQYDPSSNAFIVQGADVNEPSKKNWVI